MPVLDTRLDTRNEAFQQNKAEMLEALDEIQALLDEAAKGGGPEAMARLA
ncbi:MAG: acetyl-CoA carboxylase carboxyltransferase subunit, partial [Gemmatimonadetes bacterium]|nr:acetyl-CoA carboxylase carboxyltransferase subunit [Gemmatimonadota bacterium]